MDPASARALLCTAKNPIRQQILDVIMSRYKEEHRSKTSLDTTPETPPSRCIQKVGGGRCRKTVSEAAIVQLCWKHQKGGVIWGDNIISRCNFHKLLQRCDEESD